MLAAWEAKQLANPARNSILPGKCTNKENRASSQKDI